MEIAHRVSENGIKRTLRDMFTGASTLYKEIAQNALRAGATELHIEQSNENRTISFTNNGRPFYELDWQRLFHTAESGWDDKVTQDNNPYGIGASLMLYVADRIQIHSGYAVADIDTSMFCTGTSVNVDLTAEYIDATRIELDMVSDFDLATQSLVGEWFEGFPIKVFFNTILLDNKCKLTSEKFFWTAFKYGTLGIDLENLNNLSDITRSFVQGLPVVSGINTASSYTEPSFIIHLDSTKVRLRVPDRSQLIDAPNDLQQSVTVATTTALSYLFEQQSARIGWPGVIKKYYSTVKKYTPHLLGRSDAPLPAHCLFQLTSELHVPNYHDYQWSTFGAEYVSPNTIRFNDEQIPEIIFDVEMPYESGQEELILFGAYLYHAGFTLCQDLPASHWVNQRKVRISDYGDNAVLPKVSVVVNNVSKTAVLGTNYGRFNIALCETINVKAEEVTTTEGRTVELPEIVITNDCFHYDGTIYLAGDALISTEVFNSITDYITTNEDYERDEETTETELTILNQSVKSLRFDNGTAIVPEVLNKNRVEWLHMAEDLCDTEITVKIVKDESGRLEFQLV